MGAPRDPLFYVDVDAMAQRVGARSEDLLFLWTSESQLDPTIGYPKHKDGTFGDGSRTISTLMKNVWVPGVFDAATWAKLPAMSAREQLPYIEKAVYTPAHRALGRPFINMFETYLANAASGALRSDGRYNPLSPMYEGSPNYPANWIMDNYPAGPQQALKDKVQIDSVLGTYPYALELRDRGILKGYVSVGDLGEFAKRLPVNSGVLADAIRYLHNVRDNVAAKLAPSVDPVPEGFLTWQPASYSTGATASAPSYQPNVSDAFPPGAPIDTRIATPEAARKHTPKSAGGPNPKTVSWPALGLGVGVALGIAYLLRRS